MHDFDWSSWTDWTNLSSLDMKTVPAGPGAYILATDRPINRAVETNPLGILDTGESKGLRQRPNNFKRCATTDAPVTRLLIPMATVGDIQTLLGGPFAMFPTSFFSDLGDAAFNSLG